MSPEMAAKPDFFDLGWILAQNIHGSGNNRQHRHTRVMGGNKTGSPDQEKMLIEAARAGDERAFRQIVRLLEAPIAQTVYGMLGQCEEAADVGQETMIKLYHALPTFREEASLKTFATRIAINLCVDLIRRRKRKSWQFWRRDEDIDLDLMDSAALQQSLERKQAVHVALSALDSGQRSAVILRHLHGYSTKETAEILNVAEGTVMSRLSRAREAMKCILKENDDE